MWKLGNRVVIVLVCVVSGCVILYNIWESVLGIIITLLLITYASLLLLANDNFETPHALLLFLEYIERAGRELYNLLQNFSCQTTTYTINLIETTKTFYENYIITRMNHHRRNTYQLSTDTFVNSNRNSEFNVVEGLTPISKFRRRSYITGSENNFGIDSTNLREYGGSRLTSKVTSTPTIQWNKRESLNGDFHHNDSDTTNHQATLRRASTLQLNDHYGMSKEDETIYSPRGSPWGTSISPKMRPRPAGVKTIQTVAGPLLTSSRYNIDPKTYTDVTSPGLTSRLTKYATEANMKLIHQPQYSAGQFPKVNLHASPTPIINARSPRVRTSVTVRVAPPDTTQYSSPERQKILSAMCQLKNKTSPSVVQVLKEISLKRHASHDDITVELVKKQRTDGIHNDELENYEEMTQKRGRDDLSKSQEEISIDNTSLRPSKRSKMPSCYDIINSLSSSTIVSSGVKRKADISRSGTPDIGKHFKSLDDIQRSRSFSTSPYQNDNYKSQNDLADNKFDDSSASKNSLSSVSPKMISPYTSSLNKKTDEKETILNSKNLPIKLTDRLFMREEPQNIDKLKLLIEEHGNMSSKFIGDDDDEIKKSDVLVMRQTSMKARLQSMFDAISGKISGQIDPNVVIQAEQVNSNNSTAITTLTSTKSQFSLPLTTLNSLTSTTSINTSPISTSAVIPIIGKTKTSTTPGKHVTFVLPSATISTTNTDTVSLTKTTPSTSLSPLTTEKKMDNFKVSDTYKPTKLKFDAPEYTIATPKPVSITPKTPTTNVNSKSQSSINLSKSIISSTSPNVPKLFSPLSTNSATTIAFGIPQATSIEKIQSNTLTPVATTTITATTTGFTFSTPQTVTAAVSSIQNTSATMTLLTPTLGFQSTIASTSLASTTSTPSINLFTANKPTMPSLFTATTNPTTSAITTPSFSFGQSGNSSSVQSITDPPSQAGFSFGTMNNPTVSLNTTTTTQTQLSTKPPTDLTTTTIPSVFSFGANNSNTIASTFATTIPSVNKSIAAFGSTNNSITITTAGCTPATTSSSIFSFGATPAVTKPVFAFGTSNNSQTTTANNPLTFGSSSQVSVPAFGSSSNNNNNNNNNSSSGITTITQSIPAFGTDSTTISHPSVTSSGNTMSFTFGTQATQQATFLPTPVSTTNTNASIPQFGVAPKSTEIPAFVMNSTTINTTKNITNNSTVSVPPSTSAPLFNSAGNSNNIFGQSKIMSSTSAFGASTSTSSNFTGNTASNFSNTNQQLSFGSQQPITTVEFGTSIPVNSMSSSTFGASNITNPTVSAPPAFGASNTTSTSSGFGSLASIKSNFGAATTDFSASRPTGHLFGVRNSDSATTFNTTATAFATGAATTTTAAPPAFGTVAASTSTFGSSSGFGGTNASLSTFGSSITSPAFGSGFNPTNTPNPSSPFSNQSSNTPTFGSSNPSLPSFGTPSTINTGSGTSSSSSGAFSFGNPSTNQSQQNSPFTFGNASSNNVNNNNNNNTGSGGPTPFQFSTVAAPQPGGFNFTGGSPAPSFGGSSAGSSASASSGGMFSIGSGSTAPRTRSARQRRQQR